MDKYFIWLSRATCSSYEDELLFNVPTYYGGKYKGFDCLVTLSQLEQSNCFSESFLKRLNRCKIETSIRVYKEHRGADAYLKCISDDDVKFITEIYTKISEIDKIEKELAKTNNELEQLIKHVL
jgi:hypothetical protein